MTYLEFHLIFTLPLFGVLLWVNRQNPRAFSLKSLWGGGLLLFLAVSYTTPWDSYLIHEQIWRYEPHRVLGHFLKIPFEEYFFFVIQTLIGCLFTSWLLFRDQGTSSEISGVESHQRIIEFCPRLCLLVFLGLCLLFGLVTLSFPFLKMRYFQLILFWAMPVVGLQWALGWPFLMEVKRVWWTSISLLTSYFCVVDAIAIQERIWVFPQGTISGFKIFNILPMEEGLFFLLTNTMVVQGYLLFTTLHLKETLNSAVKFLRRSFSHG